MTNTDEREKFEKLWDSMLYPQNRCDIKVLAYEVWQAAPQAPIAVTDAAEPYLVQIGWTKVHRDGARAFLSMFEMCADDAISNRYRPVFDNQTDTLNKTALAQPKGAQDGQLS